jgi:hypothetical protein
MDNIDPEERLAETLSHGPLRSGDQEFRIRTITNSNGFTNAFLVVFDIPTGKPLIEIRMPILGLVEDFETALKKFLFEYNYPPRPSVRNQGENEKRQSYVERFMDVFEAIGDGDVLDGQRTKIWQDYKQELEKAGIDKEGIESERHRFISACKYRLNLAREARAAK